MPIFVKDYKWSDSLQKIVILVPLKGISASKTDIVHTSEYLKISFPPYIFECFFYQPVSEENAEFVASNGIMQVTVNKAEHCAWPQLMIDDADDKAATRAIRERSLQRYTELLQAASSAARANRRAGEQLSLREQMKLEEAELARVEAAKQSERDAAMRDLEAFRARQEQRRDEARRLFREEEAKQLEHLAAAVPSSGGDDDEAVFAPGIEMGTYDNKKAVEIFPDDEAQRQTGGKTRQPLAPVESVLGVRQPGRIGVSFTARVFPTPERESQKVMEEEWLRKQTERRRLADVDASSTADAAASDELSERERDPVWLRDKGNRLFAAGNFQAAANAYSHAIGLGSRMHSLYSNRAACQLKLGNCFKALEDASKALELLQPPVEQNRPARVRAHCRRAAALCGLGGHAEAVVELTEAARLAPDSAEIRADLERAKAAAAGDASDADGLDNVDD